MNNNNNNQPQMSYGQLPSNYSDIDDITRPIEYHQQPTVNSTSDPFLSQENYDDWDTPPQEISEEDGRPTVPTYTDGRW